MYLSLLYLKNTTQNLVRSSNDFLCARGSHLKNQNIFRKISPFCTKMLDFIFIAISKIIET